MANTLIVLDCGDESIVRLQLEDPGEAGSIGAWVDGTWAEASRTAFLDSFQLFANGNPVGNVRIIAQSTDKTDEPNAADLWPHLTDVSEGESGVIGNTIEYWLEHDPIDRDATVTFTIGKDVIDQGALSNWASTAQAADEQRALRKVNGTAFAPIHENIDDDATVMFVDPDAGTLPKFPNSEYGLGTPHTTYADLDTIPAADLDGTLDAVFAIDIQLTAANPRGILLEVGDDDDGASIIFRTNGRPQVRVQNTAGGDRVDLGAAATGLDRLPPTSPTMTVIFEIKRTGRVVNLYYEGRLIVTNANIASGSWTNWLGGSVADGRVGGSNGAFAGQSVEAEPARANFTISQVRYYKGVNVAPQVDGGSKNWHDMGRFNINGWGPIHSTAQAEIDKYKHRAGDIANLENPGAVDKVPNARLAHQLIRGQDDLNNPATLNGAKNAAIGLKAGMTLGGANSLQNSVGSMGTTDMRTMIEGFAGVSKTQPFVLFGWKSSGSWNPTADIIAVDMTSTIYSGKSFMDLRNTGTGGRSFWLFQDRIFHVTGLSTQVLKEVAIAFQGSLTSSRFYCGGIRFDDWPGTGHNVISPELATQDSSGRVFGEMCWNSIGENSFRSASLSTGGNISGGLFKYIKFYKSFYKNGYSPADVQTHGMGYWKGVTPYTHIKGSWIGAGPGILFKNDFNQLMVIEDMVGWRARVGFDFGNNGRTDAAVGYPATDRTEWNGPKSHRVVYQNCLISDMEDYLIATNTSAHSELRDFVGFSKTTESSLRYERATGQSGANGQEGGDSWYSGVYRGTIISNTGFEYRMALADTRTLNNSIGGHNQYISRCLMVFTGAGGRILFGQEGGDQTVAAAEAAGRNTNYRIRNCHFDFHGTTGDLVRDGANDYTDFDTAKAAVNSGDTFVNCEAGSVTLSGGVSKSPSDDPMLQYFVAAGYADYDAVEAAIVNAWAAGWQTVPAPLQTQTIINHFRSAVQPTNLDVADYGGALPGIQLLESPGPLTITNSDGTTISQPVSATAQPNTDVRFVLRLNAVGQNLTGLAYTESGVLRLETDILPLTLADGNSATFAVLLRSATLGANQTGSLTITANGGLSATVDYLLTVASPWSIRRSDGSAIPANPITGTFQQSAGGAVFQVRIDANADTLENFSYTTDGIVTLPTGPVELGPLSPGESKILNIFLDTSTLGAGQTGYAEIDFDANGVAVTTIRMEFDIEVIEAVLEASRARSRSRIR